MSIFMGFFQTLLAGVLLVFMLFGIGESIQASGQGPEIIRNFYQDPGGVSANTACYGLAFNSITPAIRADWLPAWLHPKGELLFFLEDMPLPDTTDAFGMGIILLITLFVLRLTLWRSNMGVMQKFLVAAAIVLLVVIVSYVLLKIIMYLLMFSCGEAIGMSPESIVQGRENSQVLATDFIWPSMVLSFMGCVTILCAMIKRRES